MGAYGEKPGTRDAVSGRLAAIGPAWEGTEATGSSSEAGGCRARPPSSSFAVPVDLEELRALLGDPPPPNLPNPTDTVFLYCQHHYIFFIN